MEHTFHRVPGPDLLKIPSATVDITTVTRPWLGAAVALAVLAPLVTSAPAHADVLPATPTLAEVSVVTPLVTDGEQIELAWSGDDGGAGVFYVKAVFQDFDWGSHELIDGEGDVPTTGVMRGIVDGSWASGPAVPIAFEVFDSAGDGRIYYSDDPRTAGDESRAVVYLDGSPVGTEFDGPDLFTGISVDIRQALTDTEAPRFTSVSMAQGTGLPGGNVTVNWAGADDHTGIRWIRVQLRASDGTFSQLLEEFTEGPPPSSGQISIPVPDGAVEGIYQVTALGISDNACNERIYSLGGPDFEAMSGTADCSLGGVDPDARVPDDVSIAGLVFGVIMLLPPLEAPEAPTGLTVMRSNGQWAIEWTSSSALTSDGSLMFYDWLYQVEVDGDIVAYPWPDTGTTINDSLVSPGWHTVRVRAVNRFGPGGWSLPLTFSTQPSGPVEDLTATGRLWGGRVDWTPPTTGESADHYVVTRRPGNRTLDQMPGPSTSALGLTATRYSARDLVPGRSYTFAVFAIDAQGQESAGTVAHLTGTRTKVRATELRPRHKVELRGRVVDANGSGVPRVPVLIQKASTTDLASFSTTHRTATTTADGHYRITVTPRRGFAYRVATSGAPTYAPSWSAALS